MRIASVNQDPGVAPGRSKGAVVHVAAMRAAFAARGDEVIAIDEPNPRAVFARLEAIEAERQLDAIYERYALGRAEAARFAEARGIPYVVEANAPLAFEASRWRSDEESAATRSDDAYLFGAAVAVLAVSTAVAEYAVTRGARPERVEVVPNGVDRQLFSPARRDEWTAEGPVPQGRFVIGFHGRLRPWHGFESLAAVCRGLLERGIELHLLAVGEGDFAAELDGSVPADRRTLVGWLPHDEVGRYVALFDVLPLAYPRELPCYFSPLKLAEAMAAGAVPVVPASGDLPEIVGTAGVVYPAGDLAALSVALEDLARDRQRRIALSGAAVGRAARHSWQRIAALVGERVGARAVR